MDSLSNAVNASIMTRLLANIFAFLVLASALAVAVYELVMNQPINSYVIWVLGTGTGYVLHLLGLNQGVTLAPINPPPVKIQKISGGSIDSTNNDVKP